ncbi:MAG: ATP-binding protein, partial [Myxococcota bacterium]
MVDAARSFIGRGEELSALAGAVERLARDGIGGLCLIEGDPGIGKTRLARELAESPEASALRVAWGRGWEAGRAPSY